MSRFAKTTAGYKAQNTVEIAPSSQEPVCSVSFSAASILQGHATSTEQDLVLWDSSVRGNP